MKIILGAYPRIRHGQRVTRGQANRFFQQVRPWIQLANNKIAHYMFTKNRKKQIPVVVEGVRQGLSTIHRHLDWLKDRGFSNLNIERDLDQLEERLGKLRERIES